MPTISFDAIAPRYDMLNHFLSARRDVAWRRRLVFSLPPGESRVLDVASGTGDVLRLIQQLRPACRGMGVDTAPAMLRIAQRKLGETIPLMLADGRELPFPDNTFDAVTIAFGIRNIQHPTEALREFRRILRPGGTLAVLEFGLPRNILMRRVYLAYLRHALPHIGGFLSGDPVAYRYLNTSVETFPCGDDFTGLMRAAGFMGCVFQRLTGGVAFLYNGVKA